jgi:hypothetical protein
MKLLAVIARPFVAPQLQGYATPALNAASRQPDPAGFGACDAGIIQIYQRDSLKNMRFSEVSHGISLAS